MEPVTIALLASAAVNLGSAIYGKIMESKSADEARKILEKESDKLGGIELPKKIDLPKLKTAMADYQRQSLGDIEQRIKAAPMPGEVIQGPTAFGQISLDPRLKEAQMRALRGLEDVSRGGLMPEDRAMLADMAEEEARKSRAARESIQMQALQQGISGGGIEALGKLTAEEAAISRLAQRDRDVAAMAQKRALEAMLSGGELAGSMEQTQYNRQADLARAKDDIARWNADVKWQRTKDISQLSRDDISALMKARQTEADFYNQWYNAQVANTKYQNDLARQQYIDKVNAAQQEFTNKMTKAGQTVPMAQTMADIKTKEGEATSRMIGGIGQAGSQAISAWGQYANSPKQTPAPSNPNFAPNMPSSYGPMTEQDQYDYEQWKRNNYVAPYQTSYGR